MPAQTPRAAPLLFVHGGYTGAWCWDDYFLPYFAERGYHACALSLRGHGTSHGREALDAAGISDYVADVAVIARRFEHAPVLIGHSMGATVVQRCLRQLEAAAAVLVAPVPPEGLMGPALALAARDPSLFGEINLMQHAHPGFATVDGLRRAVFSRQMPDDVVLRHFSRMQPESQRALFDLSWPQYFFIGRPTALPVMVLGAQQDNFFPPPVVEATARYYGVKAEIFPDTAHSIMLESGWQVVAERIVEWLASHGL